MYQLERKQWLYEVLQKHQSSIICLFIFVHSVMHDIGPNIPSIVCGFYNVVGVRSTFFQKERFEGYIFGILRAECLLGEKLFFNSFGTTEVLRIFTLSVVPLENFPKQIESHFQMLKKS